MTLPKHWDLIRTSGMECKIIPRRADQALEVLCPLLG